MVIGIDYDGTITLAPDFWLEFINAAMNEGNKVIIVTGREASQPIKVHGIPVVYAGDTFKREAAENEGYFVDVWIDDEPGHIEPCRKLEWK